MTGIIVKAVSGFYYVNFQDKVYTCKAKGSFRKSGISPLVGDRAEFEILPDETGIIKEIYQRKSCLKRPPVANIDKLFIVSSYEFPAPNTLIIDKLTVIARHSGIEPVIVFNKSDMGDFSRWLNIYKNAGFKTYLVSAAENKGIEDIKTELKDCISAFTGNSGVGKSSILNRILETNRIVTGAVSEKLGRGRHTTRHTELYPLPFGGYVADTPGFSSLTDEAADYYLKEHLAEYFYDFTDYIGECRFSGCSHVGEKGCAVTAAVNDGKIESTRYESYKFLYNECKDIKEWEKNKRKPR